MFQILLMMMLQQKEIQQIKIEEQLKTFRLIFKGHLELDKDMPFREDIQRIEEFQKAMSSLNTSIFESAALRFDKQDEVSSCTTKQTLTMYVSIFVALVKDTYQGEEAFHLGFRRWGCFGDKLWFNVRRD
ncbi:hypothetical protein HU200_063594 [Digitaria exilis]|uniref:Uncharacterized protein n=1 Tax=Digitaria exilis TaxID=1010633 RepID=A0A835DX86_9POAL|nr:hypothetical protein HU200_063594 [Digitaria exilis]